MFAINANELNWYYSSHHMYKVVMSWSAWQFIDLEEYLFKEDCNPNYAEFFHSEKVGLDKTE